jgi:hypothetical protein
MSRSAGGPCPASSPCGGVTRGCAGRARLPAPADLAGEDVFLRLRCERARLALAAIRAVLAHRESGPAEIMAAARRLRDCLADGYGHSSFSS